MDLLKDIRSHIAHRLRPLRKAKMARSAFFRKFPSGDSVFLVNSRTLIDFQRQFVYSRIPKAANSTVVATLYVEETDHDTSKSVRYLKRGEIAPVELSREQVSTLTDSFFKFTFVRNPYSRVVSCYLDKFLRPHSVGEKARRLMGMSSGSEVTFTRFLELISTDRGRLLDAHWARQTELLAFPVTA